MSSFGSKPMIFWGDRSRRTVFHLLKVDYLNLGTSYILEYRRDTSYERFSHCGLSRKQFTVFSLPVLGFFARRRMREFNSGRQPRA